MQLDFTLIFMIIDEAHNVETNWSDGRSFHHTRNTLNCDLIYIKKTNQKTLNKKIPKKKNSKKKSCTQHYFWHSHEREVQKFWYKKRANAYHMVTWSHCHRDTLIRHFFWLHFQTQLNFFKLGNWTKNTNDFHLFLRMHSGRLFFPQSKKKQTFR